MTLKNRCSTGWMAGVVMLSYAMTAGPAHLVAAENPSSSAEKQRKLISVLQSDAPPKEKAISCKQLAIYGAKDAVPALAPLLLDTNLASWARIALEAIPDPAADDALRAAMSKLQGRLLIGTINSIGYRRDAKAVDDLAAKLKEADPEVVAAAANALGRIGGESAAVILFESLATLPAGSRPAVAEGCILCAERFLTEGKFPRAMRLYDAVRQAEVPNQRIIEAIRGAILARQANGLPLLLEQLRSADKARFSIGLRTARELPGRPVTEVLAAELNQCRPERQSPLLLAIADRGDEAVLPAVLGAARGGAKKLRLTALAALERLGNAACVPTLVDAAAEDDAELAQTAKASLIRLSGKEVDADLLSRLNQTTGKRRQVLIELTALRRVDGALPVILGCLGDADAGVRRAATEAIGAIGESKQAGDLVKLLLSGQNAPERDSLEKALLALSGRAGADCVPHLLPLAQNDNPALRIIALHALACVGGAEALAPVKSALNDPDEAVQDEAVRTLSTWANNWPEDAGVAEPLLALVKSGKKMSHQVLGLRGYLHYVQGDKQLNDEAKVAKVNELLPLIQRPEEKRLAISTLGAIPTGSALELVLASVGDSAIAEEACAAVISLAGKNLPGVPREQRRKALQTVIEKSPNDTIKKRAQDTLLKVAR